MTQDNLTTHTGSDPSSNDQSHKIQSLRDMISNAEQTIQSAKAMLLQLEGKKKVGRKRKVEDLEDGNVVEGTFDGQIMIGTDGKHYPVPANYASKSKLVQGDMLKLTITGDGSFIYKQIGPAERKHAIGIMSQDEGGNHYVVADGKAYRVLLASVTYFHAEPGDEVAIVLPRDLESTWAAIENIIQKASLMGSVPSVTFPTPIKKPATHDIESWKQDVVDVDELATPEISKPASQSIEPELVITTPKEKTPTVSDTSEEDVDALRQEIIDDWMKEMNKDTKNEE